MPRYYRRFSGHMPTGDPRTPLTAAGGCAWPTVPAVRYGFKCPTGTGIWQMLQYHYLGFQYRTVGSTHDLAYWDVYIARPPFVTGVLTKQKHAVTDDYTWSLALQLSFGGWISTKTVPGDPDGCNENVLIPHMTFALPASGESGDDSSLIPFEYDQDEPPWPWPPM